MQDLANSTLIGWKLCPDAFLCVRKFPQGYIAYWITGAFQAFQTDYCQSVQEAIAQVKKAVAEHAAQARVKSSLEKLLRKAKQAGISERDFRLGMVDFILENTAEENTDLVERLYELPRKV